MGQGQQGMGQQGMGQQGMGQQGMGQQGYGQDNNSSGGLAFCISTFVSSVMCCSVVFLPAALFCW